MTIEDDLSRRIPAFKRVSSPGYHLKVWRSELPEGLIFTIRRYGGDLPFMACVKAKGDEHSKRVDLGKFATFEEARTVCKKFWAVQC